MGIAAYLAVRTGTAFVEAVAAAGTGIHGRHQDEARRIGQGRLDAGNVDDAVFQGLAQDFQNRPGELRQFVEEEDTVMAEGHFARLGDGPAADEAGHGNGVMRAAERPLLQEPPLAQKAGDAVYLGHFQGLGFAHGRQDSRDALGQHGLAASRRADHEDVMAAGCGDFQDPLGFGLALDFGEVDVIVQLVRRQGFRPGRVQRLFTGQAGGDVAERIDTVDREVRTEQGFGGIVAADEDRLHPLGGPFQDHGQDTVHRPDAPVQGQFPHEEAFFAGLFGNLAARHQDGHGQAQIQAGRVLLQVSRRQVDRQAAHGKFIAAVLDGSPDPLFGLFHRRRCQADQV